MRRSPHWNIIGDPTEGSLIVAAKKAGIDIEAELVKSPRIKELTFESNRKRMSTIHKFYENTSEEVNIAYVKGAPKEVVNLCTKFYENGKHNLMSEAISEEIVKANDGYASEGLRVLAIAMRVLPKQEVFTDKLNECTNELIEQDLKKRLALLCILIYVPFLHGVFNTAPIGLSEWSFLLIWPVIVLLLDEMRKAILRKKYSRRK